MLINLDIFTIGIHGSTQNDPNNPTSLMQYLEMDNSEGPILTEGRKLLWKIHEVVKFIDEKKPFAVRLNGNNLNATFVIQLANLLVDRRYQLIQNAYETPANDILDDIRYAGDSLIFYRMTTL